MGPRWVRWVGAVLGVPLAVAAAVQGNVIGAVFFGACTISSAWFAIRPEPSPDKQVRPFRALSLFAAGLTLLLAVVVAAALGAFGEPPRSDAPLAVLAAVLGVFALFMAGLVLVMRRRGWRWGSTTTYAELHAAREEGRPVPAPELSEGQGRSASSSATSRRRPV